MYMYIVSSISLNIIGIKIIFFVGHAYLAYWKCQLNISKKKLSTKCFIVIVSKPASKSPDLVYVNYCMEQPNVFTLYML